MADIIERFDFDDRPGLEKLANLGASMDNLSQSVQDLQGFIQGTAEGIAEGFKDVDKVIDDSGKKVGKTAGIYAELSRQAVLFFKKAAKGAVDLANENARIAETSEKIGKKADDVRKVLSDKLAPIVFVIQQTILKLLDKVAKGGADINNSVIVKIAAGIKGIQAVFGRAFRNLSNSIKITINEAKILGKNIQAIFSTGTNKQSIKAEIEALRKENEALSKDIRFVGDAYREAFDATKKSIGDLVNSGYFNLKKANKEQIDQILKLREEYAKLTGQIQQQVEQSRIDAADGLKRLELEEKAALREIDLIEEEARALAKQAGIQFDQEKNLNEIRFNIESQFQQERKELIDKTNAEIAKESRELFKKAFGIYFEDLDELGKKSAAKRLKDEDDLFDKIRAKNNKALADQAKDAEAEARRRLDLGPLGRFREDLFKSLNLTDEQGDFLLDSVGQALKGVEGLFTASINARLQENDRLIQNIQQRRELVQSQLEEELRLQKEGRANNVASKREELLQLQKEQEAAQKERDKLEKKARAAQVVSDSIQQTSSLITTASNLFKGFSNIPIVGLALGAAAVAGLFILFNSIKAKAAAAAKPQERLYKGGSLRNRLKKDRGYVNWLGGRSDVPGFGDGHRIEDSDLVVGGREMVVGADAAAAQSDRFWDDVNSGKYNGIDLETALMDPRTNNRKINAGFEKKHTKIVRFESKQKQYISRDEMESIIKAQTQDMIRYLKSKPDYIAETEETVRIRKITADEQKIIHLGS